MRDRRLEAAGLLAIVIAGSAVWLMHHPEAAIVARAARWPVVGPAVRAVRQRFEPVPPPPRRSAPSGVAIPGEAAISPASDRPEPRRSPPRSLSRPPSVPEVRRFASRDAVEPTAPLEPRSADVRRLDDALARLGSAASRHELVGYELHSDLAEAAEIARRWRLLIADSERAWRSRYGLEPIGRAAESIVLFSRRSDFLAFAEQSDVAAREVSGLSLAGVVALDGEAKHPSELDGSLLHELGHLLARRSIGPALPPWLAEGLAEDFGEAPLDAGGRLDFERVRGVVIRDRERFEIRGGLAAIDRAGRRAATGSVPGLAAYAALDTDLRDGGESAIDLYADVFIWFRFLLSRPETASGVRRFLAAVRSGGEPSLVALERHLPRPVAELAPALGAWLLELRARELSAHGAPAALPDGDGIIRLSSGMSTGG